MAYSIYGLLLLSGFAGLGYQIVWIRMLSVGLGHEIFAVLAVVSAFFAGLAIGAFALDGRIARSRRPGLWYAVLEAIIGLWTLALIWLIPLANGLLAEWIGQEPSELRRWAFAFLGPILLLAPATMAMGASLPAAERLYARLRRDGRGIGGLYAANTAGAMAGALLTAVLLAPLLGYSNTLICFAAANFLCAAGVLIGPARGEAARPALDADSTVKTSTPHNAIFAALFLTGLIGIGYEVAVVRALSQILENTVYSFAAALAVYLLGTALGAAAYQRLYARRRASGWDLPALAVLAPLVAVTCALGALAVLATNTVYGSVRSLLGADVTGSIGAEMAAAFVVFGPASAAMGALFTHLAQATRRPDGGLGTALGANTAGAALAPLLVGVAAVPALSIMATLATLSLAYLGFAILFRANSLRRQPLRWALWGAAPALVALLLLGPFDRTLISLPNGHSLRTQIEGTAATATVDEDTAGDRFLRVNGSFTMGGTRSYILDRIQGHAALLQHPAPRRALFLGVGTGATLAAAAAYPNLRAEGVELLPEVLSLIPEFPLAHRDLASTSHRISLHSADARRFIRAADGPYDVVVSDTFHPAKDGAGLLYTREHFAAVKAKLANDGLFAQWLPLHQLDMPTLRLIARTFLDVFPDARLAMGNSNLGTPLLVLFGARSGQLPVLAALSRREMDRRLLGELNAIGLDTPFALFGGFLAGPEELARFAGEGPLNTDDHPHVVFTAPRTVYRPLPPAQERLLALTEAFSPRAADAVSLAGLPNGFELAARLERYWQARDAFIRLGTEHRLSGNVSHDIRMIGPDLLDIVHTSPDFSPAYQPLLRMARALSETERALSLRFLEALQQASPHRQEAAALHAAISRRGSVLNIQEVDPADERTQP